MRLTHQRCLRVFKAQCVNTQSLETAERVLRKQINQSIRKRDTASVASLTKVHALLFAAWSEALFSKLIHTPYGFSLTEIEQIIDTNQRLGLERAWIKCIQLGLRKVKSGRSNYIPNWDKRFARLVDTIIADPRQIRNKIAHGQWVSALNRDNNDLNELVTYRIAALDDIEVRRWFLQFSLLAQMVESLIESPNRAFHRDATMSFHRLDEFVKSSSGWSMRTLISKLDRKPIKS